MASGTYATVGGGSYNEATKQYATAGGGYEVNASGLFATVGGGSVNTASGPYATIAGGIENKALGEDSTIGGGWNNKAVGMEATVPGGRDNEATGDYSFAAGRRAKAHFEGTFVWGDSTNSDIFSPAAKTFSVRAAGGIWMGTTSSPSIPAGRFLNTSTGGYLTTGGAWTNASDRNLKDDFVPVDPAAVLQQVLGLPIATCRYKAEDNATRHMGPVAQDFHAAFAVGTDATSISTVDADGVALAAIQGLNEKLEQENASLRAQIQVLGARLERLEQALSIQE